MVPVQHNVCFHLLAILVRVITFSLKRDIEFFSMLLGALNCLLRCAQYSLAPLSLLCIFRCAIKYPEGEVWRNFSNFQTENVKESFTLLV